MIRDRVYHDMTNRGVTGWIVAALLTGFYVALYFTEALTPWAKAVGLSSKWDLYGVLYTVAIVGGGLAVMRKYGHNRYQVIRTSVVMFVQVVFAFSIPQMLKFFHQPDYYLSYFWPLKFDYMNPEFLFRQPLWFVVYTLAGSLVIVPLLGALFGKRWYCSWVCGCGGLANTFGEPWRHLSDKSSAAWKFEKVSIYTVLGLSLALTGLLFYSWGTGSKAPVVIEFQSWYGLLVGSVLSGVVGVGLYPLGGTRVWCRYFCPMAALLGISQKTTRRFHIRVKEDMCISCGLCSKYCEMGIDVRAYAQANESFTRASCVGCGICSEVCPRGVLRLENQSGLIQISGGR